MKKFYKLALTLVAVMLTGLTAFAADVKVGNLYYTLDAGAKTATVARNTEYKTLTTVTIPGKITVDNVEYTVTAVAQQAFQEFTSITSVTFEPGVKEIGKWAFYKCSGIKTLNLPSTLKSALTGAFRYCSGIEELSIPEGVTSLDGSCFRELTGLKKLTLPTTMRELTGSVFYGCSSLKELNLNTGITTISGDVFYASGLETVNIPANVVLIEGCFSQSKQLRTVTGSQGLKTIGTNTFFQCDRLESVALTNELSSIGENVFYECVSLKSINLPQDLFSIGAHAFHGCTSLSEITIPKNIRYLSNCMFSACSGLRKVTLPENLVEIGQEAFQSCTSLTSIDLPATLTTIKNQAFNHCSSLKEVTLPEKITSLGMRAFAGTAITKFNIPAGLTSIGDIVTIECPYLEYYTVAEGNPNYAAIDGVLTNKEKTVLLQYPGGRKGEYTVPEGIESIAELTFSSNSNLTGINFPKSLKEIGMSAFYQAFGIRKIVLPEALKSIGGTCFFLAGNIKEIILPNTDLAIGTTAFGGTNVERMIFPETMTQIGIQGSQSFSILGGVNNLKWVSLPSGLKKYSPVGFNCPNLKTIYSFAVKPADISGANAVDGAITFKVPKGSAAAYKAAWSNLYPSATFEDALPTGATVNMIGADATLSWEPYSDANLAAPVRYTLVLKEGETVVSAIEISGEKAQGKNLSHVWNGLEKKVYTYELQGFQQTGEMSLRYTGEFDMNNSGISDIEIDGNTAPAEYYDLMGRKVMNPAKGQMLIKRQGNKAEKVVF